MGMTVAQYDKLMDLLEGMDEDSLLEANKLVIGKIKGNRSVKNLREAAKYYVEEEVEWKDKQGRWNKGRIKTVNQRTVSLYPINGVHWRIGLHETLLRKAA